MLSNCFTIACGQGATKAMIQAIQEDVLDEKYCKIINSTAKDIPNKYKDISIVISDDPDAGCGKVREAAKALMMQYMKDHPNLFETIIDTAGAIDCVNVITTTEGASGSGASIIVAKYIKQVIQVPVNIILITGFESDTRGLQNTINYFKDLSGADYTIRIVSNKRFLENGVTTFAAEELANHEIATILSTIQGQYITSSDHNIDATDHYRIITNTGLMFTGEIDIDNKKYKNIDQTNKDLANMVDYSSSLDFTPSATKIGIYMNISDNNLDAIDTTFEVIKKKLCGNNTVPELFIHRQYNTNFKQFIRVIATGMDLPTEEVKDMYSKYQASTDSINNRKSDFFDTLNNMETNQIKESLFTDAVDNSMKFFNDNQEDISEETEMVINRSRKRKFTTKNSNSIKPTTNTPINNIETKNNDSGTVLNTNKHNKTYTEDNIENKC